ncbi:Methionine vitamin-b12 [Mycena sanguinolenta]|uniref:Methionine vitamin-b12 n=1 Tax=Mycena sanguinolenta TaxID=230812 RepID=A0A8H6ZJI0_9AGAR|nr:Methionine vitamin-b12 [Mycena sanguinolenta]
MAPTFRADHIGSLLRPPPPSWHPLSSDIAEATRAAMADAVKKQLELSIRPITSGEYDRTTFYSGFFEKLEGMTMTKGLPVPDAFRTGLIFSTVFLRMGRTVREANIATAPIRSTSAAYLEAWEMLKWVTPLANGTTWAPGVYGDDRAYFTDLATAYRAELKDLLMTPTSASSSGEMFQEGCRTDGVDLEELFDLYLWALNEAVRDRPTDMHIGIHTCRGNTVHFHDIPKGSYESIDEKMLTKLNYDQFYLEYEDPERDGSFAPLRFLPQGRSVVLGIVSTNTGELEDIDMLEARVREAAEIIAKGQERSVEEVLEDILAVSPQCGFASVNVNGSDSMLAKASRRR